MLTNKETLSQENLPKSVAFYRNYLHSIRVIMYFLIHNLSTPLLIPKNEVSELFSLKTLEKDNSLIVFDLIRILCDLNLAVEWLGTSIYDQVSDFNQMFEFENSYIQSEFIFIEEDVQRDFSESQDSCDYDSSSSSDEDNENHNDSHSENSTKSQVRKKSFTELIFSSSFNSNLSFHKSNKKVKVHSSHNELTISYKSTENVNEKPLQKSQKNIEKLLRKMIDLKIGDTSFSTTNVDKNECYDLSSFLETMAEKLKPNEKSFSLAQIIPSKLLCCMIDQMIIECINILGPAPCTYCLVSIGSLARYEICPFSDLECVMLIENEKGLKYFTQLCHMLELRSKNNRILFFFEHFLLL